MEEVKKQGRPAKKAGLPIYQKVKLEVEKITKDGEIKLREVSVMRECLLTDLDAATLNTQEKNTLIRYKKK